MVQKLKRIKVEEKLKALGVPVFTPREFRDIFGISANTASVFIKRNLKSGLFIKLRNNYYVLKDSNPSLCLIANKLYQPSYISLQTALSHYGIIPEVVYATTSVTAKMSREFATPKGDFIYRRIKKTAFTGYGLRYIDRDNVFIAEPEKALADYLYFVDLKKVSLNDRLALANVNKKKLIQSAKLFKRSSLLKLVDRVYVEHKKPRKIY
ncbi:MAG: hypothetical protein Q8P88_00750 [Candidatus Jorgensenbacteria bacterium]|nr:hypothetical protein [Candidatus Jorgensenbacteria bacterium]